ncbi:hypothetical protein [Candidatus Burkholderia verschuerenii]|uniref:hypothetical protein n=1 Tax=Candidatus Burkholderia verschuerenii TaxID=242163 RepID=UPI00067AC5E0|nr:hypothetical protein [Candidatus Burkholderia verschuerenii]
MSKKLIAACALFCATLAAHAQTGKPDDGASMVKPPPSSGAPSANGARPSSPDDMPVKRPTAPPGSDRMLHNNPASDAIAK